MVNFYGHLTKICTNFHYFCCILLKIIKNKPMKKFLLAFGIILALAFTITAATSDFNQTDNTHVTSEKYEKKSCNRHTADGDTTKVKSCCKKGSKSCSKKGDSKKSCTGKSGCEKGSKSCCKKSSSKKACTGKTECKKGGKSCPHKEAH